MEKTSVTLGHIGNISYAIKESLELLGVEVFLSEMHGHEDSKEGSNNLKSEICHPLKLLLGNYLSLKHQKTKNVIFYNGCDLCNLTAIYDVFLNIFKENEWIPKAYYFNVANDILFLKDYYINLKKISKKNAISVMRALICGFQKFQLFEYLDKIFALIRPLFSKFNSCEDLYLDFFKKIQQAKKSQYKMIKEEINHLMQQYKPDYSLLHVGLIGDPFSLMEPFLHQNTHIKLGHLGVIVDKWLNNPLINKKIINNFEIRRILKNKYGVMTEEEFNKINKYIRKSYDGLVFITPFSCNPNDALKNQLAILQEEANIPILSLSFDSHSSEVGLETRLEAFVDLLKRKKLKGRDVIIK